MRESKLLILIRTLEKTEMKKLLLFLESPYFFNGKLDEEVLRLFQFIYNYYPNFEHADLSKANAYTSIFPDQKPLKGKMDRLMTRLLKHIQLFLAYEQTNLKENKTQQNIVLSTFYRERHLDKLFLRNIESIRKLQNRIQERDKDFYYNQFLIEEELANWESFYNTRREDLNLTATLQSLDIYYMVAKLEYACRLLAQNKYHQTLDLKDSLEIINRIAPVFEQEHYVKIPILRLYHQAFQLLQAENADEVFRQLSQELEENEPHIPLHQMKDLQTIIRSYSVDRYNQGNEQFLEETFKYYRLHLERGYLLYEDGLNAGTFRNIVALGLKLKQYEWVKSFMEAYQDKIVGAKHPEEVYSFNLATYHFALGEYDKALEYLSDNYEDMYYKIAAKRLELQIYYEQQSVLLDPRMNAFKVYIFRISKTLLPELKREGYNNFIDFLKRIYSPKTYWDKDRVHKLLKEVEECKVLVEKEWLRKKLQEISE
ncbi:MAG: hypothetical protein AAF985_07190, partial [Bacteroidota bacterium]